MNEWMNERTNEQMNALLFTDACLDTSKVSQMLQGTHLTTVWTMGDVMTAILHQLAHAEAGCVDLSRPVTTSQSSPSADSNLHNGSLLDQQELLSPSLTSLSLISRALSVRLSRKCLRFEQPIRRVGYLEFSFFCFVLFCYSAWKDDLFYSPRRLRSYGCHVSMSGRQREGSEEMKSSLKSSGSPTSNTEFGKLPFPNSVTSTDNSSVTEHPVATSDYVELN